MSRCLRCNRTFAEENAWQEFCSLPCAQRYVIGRTIEELGLTKRRDADAFRMWADWITSSKNNRRVRYCEEPEPPPKIGKFEERVVEWREGNKRECRKVRVNVGGEITIRPMTDDERAAAKRYRGHDFYDCHVATTFGDDLPSLHWHVGEEWFPHDDDLYVPPMVLGDTGWWDCPVYIDLDDFDEHLE